MLNLVWQRGSSAAASPGSRAAGMPVYEPKTAAARYEWESIVFMPQQPAGEPVCFMNGKLWSLVHSIKGTAG